MLKTIPVLLFAVILYGAALLGMMAAAFAIAHMLVRLWPQVAFFFARREYEPPPPPATEQLFDNPLKAAVWERRLAQPQQYHICRDPLAARPMYFREANFWTPLKSLAKPLPLAPAQTWLTVHTDAFLVHADSPVYMQHVVKSARQQAPAGLKERLKAVKP